MPDYTSAALSGRPEGPHYDFRRQVFANAVLATRVIAQLSDNAALFAYRREARQPLWQHGYHERILRDDETTEVVVRYILENPIRAGLATALGAYPLAGSGVYDLDGLKSAWERQA